MKPIDLSDEKLRNAIIFFVRHTKKVGITKLMKLLYFLDFRHYHETGLPVTGQTYRTWQYGPVPVGVWDELRNKNDRGLDLKSVVNVIPSQDEEEGTLFIKAMTKAKFDEDVFTRRELRILKELAEIFKNVSAKCMVDATHARNQPWEKVLRERGEDVDIDYEMIFDGSESPELMEVIRERQKEHREIRSMIEVL